MRQCCQCYKYFFPDEDYEMNHCGGSYEDVCEKCQAKIDRKKDNEEEE